MGFPVARIGDTSDHGGSVVTGSATFSTGGIPVARVGDSFSCPQHGVNPIISSIAINADDGGQKLAHIGSKTACGATITTGDASFTVE